ncbi:MAG TPA: carboxylate--amine ligase [Candidatus Xenobia bacterium]|jgi:hypothetical protein
MNFVCLSPHFPPNFRNFWRRLAENGATVLGLGDSPADELGEAGPALAEYFRVGDLHHYPDLVKALGWFTFRYGRLDRLESHNEYWLETDAALRTDFNIPGPHRENVVRVKHKSLMKEVFRSAGIDVARGRVVRNRREAEALAEDLGFPLIAKPDVGVGAAGTVRLRTGRDLVDLFDNKPPADYILEEELTGTLCSFDGMVDAEGHIVFYTSHVFCTGVMEIVNNDEDMFYYSLREVPEDLEKAGRAAVAAFGLRERFFHIEFWRRKTDQSLVAMEINMRPPGGLTTDMFNFANDIDVYREYANLVTTGRFWANWSRPYHVMYIGRKNYITYKHSIEDVVSAAGGLVVHHQQVQSVFARAIGDYCVMARHPELPPLMDLIRYVLAS